MTHKAVKKGPKFGTPTAMKASAAPAEQPFEIEIPKGVQELIAQLRRRANTEIEMWVRDRQQKLDESITLILQGALGTMPDVPKNVNLAPNESYTKLVQK